ncbi:Alpha/Beta hydrolase protein [Cyathus striatus]|nr:Alpha/Beta hydrolase protein [Cyathus striatus]
MFNTLMTTYVPTTSSHLEAKKNHPNHQGKAVWLPLKYVYRKRTLQFPAISPLLPFKKLKGHFNQCLKSQKFSKGRLAWILPSSSPSPLLSLSFISWRPSGLNMKEPYRLLVFLFCLCTFSLARNTTTDGKLSYVKNSGICETTPGVGQVSGYIEIAKDTYMWFWFFEARHNKDNAPLTLWLNGGPGCSSMIGLFQENGPCTVNADSRSTTLNPFSWNNISNMLYIDQPINAGFSYGPKSQSPNNTEQAAAQLWTAFQALFDSSEFSKFRYRELLFATESYGARFSSHTIQHFNTKNKQIASGKLTGHVVKFSSLMVSNGRHDPLTLARSYIDFAANAPGYGPLQNETVISTIKENFYQEDGCRSRLMKCNSAENSRDTAELCLNAYVHCQNTVYRPAVGNRDDEDLRQPSNSSFPPTHYLKYVRSGNVVNTVGTRVRYDQCSDEIRAAFATSGEFGRSNLPVLAPLANAKFPILIWVGDADIKCNWLGVHDAMIAMNWYGNENLRQAPFRNITINERPAAEFKDVDQFTFARVYGAGHALPAFQPQAAFEIFLHFSTYKNLRGLENRNESGSLATVKRDALTTHKKRNSH